MCNGRCVESEKLRRPTAAAVWARRMCAAEMTHSDDGVPCMCTYIIVLYGTCIGTTAAASSRMYRV